MFRESFDVRRGILCSGRDLMFRESFDVQREL